jgi:hypothetical protein
MEARVLSPGTGSSKVGFTIKGVGIGVGVLVFVGVGVGVFVGIDVGVFVGVDVGVFVFVGVGISVFVGVGMTTAAGIGVGFCVGTGVGVGGASWEGNGKLGTPLVATSSTAQSIAAILQFLGIVIPVGRLKRLPGGPKSSTSVSGCAASILSSSWRSQYKGAGKPEARA